MAPKKPTVTSSNTRSARAKTGSNPVVTKGEARTRAARTTLGPAPKQRPMATGGTKGPLQGGTRTGGQYGASAPTRPMPSGRGQGPLPNRNMSSRLSDKPKPATGQRALPAAGKTGGNQANAAKSARVARMQARRAAEAAAGKPSGVRQGQPAGAANRMFGVNAVNAAVKRAQGGAMLGKVGKFGGKLLGPVAVASDAFVTAKDVFNPKDNIIHDLGNLGTAVENAISGKDSGRRYSGNSPVAKAGNIKRGLNKPASKPAAKPAASTSRFAGARDAAMAKAKAIKGSPVVGPKTASAPARMSAPAARSSAPSAPKAAAPKASAPKSAGPARMSASTYNRVSGNYGTSRSNNPLMADFKDSLPSKAADPDAGYSPKTKVSSEGIKGAPTDVTKLAFSNPKLSAERTRKIKRG